jgi:hypothetical protein
LDHLKRGDFSFQLLTSFNVGGEVDLGGQLRDVDVEAVLDRVESLGVGLVADERDGQALRGEREMACYFVPCVMESLTSSPLEALRTHEFIK